MAKDGNLHTQKGILFPTRTLKHGEGVVVGGALSRLARPSHAGSDSLNGDCKCVTEHLDVFLVFVNTHA